MLKTLVLRPSRERNPERARDVKLKPSRLEKRRVTGYGRYNYICFPGRSEAKKQSQIEIYIADVRVLAPSSRGRALMLSLLGGFCPEK